MIKTKPLRKAMHDIAAGRGEFTLFALLLRADAPGTWDLMVSAPWLESGTLKGITKFVRLLTNSIGEESLQQLARVLVLNEGDGPVKFILKNMPVEDGEVHIQSTDVCGVQIEKAIIFRAKKAKPRPPVAVKRTPRRSKRVSTATRRMTSR